MARWFAIPSMVFVTLAGCNVPVSGVFGPESTPLVPGFYEGEQTCETTLSAAGSGTQTESYMSDQPISISANGFPVVEGVEQRVGNVTNTTLGDFVVVQRVESLTSIADGAVLTLGVTLSLAELGDFAGEGTETLRHQDDGSIAYSSRLGLGRVGANSAFDFAIITCQGTYSSENETTAERPVATVEGEFLTRDDVENLPLGDAVGNHLTGVYRLGAVIVEDCRCVDTDSEVEDSVCLSVRGNPLAVIDLVQEDGMLSGVTRDSRLWFAWGDSPFEDFGGTGNAQGFGEFHVYANGTFAAGGVVPLIDTRTGAISGEGVSYWTGSWDKRGMFGEYRIRLQGNVTTDRGVQGLNCEQVLRVDVIRIE